MSETLMTVRGRAAHSPELHHSAGRAPMATFRVGVNPRYFDRAKGEWVDGRTEWYSVKCFGNLALNAAFSIDRGQPVIVYGRFQTSEWQPKDGGPPRLSLELIASSIGHDMRLGSTRYARTRYDENGKEVKEDAPSTSRSDSHENKGDGERDDPAAAEVQFEPEVETDQELVSAGT